jgi:hypothetical protein
MIPREIAAKHAEVVRCPGHVDRGISISWLTIDEETKEARLSAAARLELVPVSGRNLG